MTKRKKMEEEEGRGGGEEEEEEDDEEETYYMEKWKFWVSETFKCPLVLLVKGSTRLVIQDRQCTYNVTLRRVRVTIVVVETAKIIKYYEFVFVTLRILRANHFFSALYYYVICGPSGSTTFLHIIS